MNLLTKITLFIHRILGTAFSILFLVWFLSGLVMIYHTFPRADRADKRAKMDILSLENLPSLDQIEKRLPQNERISHVTLNSYLGQTVFHIRTEKGSYDIPADSTERLPVIDWNRIQRVASQWNTSSIAKVDSLYTLDQWIPFGRLKEELRSINSISPIRNDMNYTYPLNPGRFCNIRIKTVVSGLGSGRSLIGFISLPCGKTLNYG